MQLIGMLDSPYVRRIAIALIVGLMLFAGWNDINHTGLVQYLSHLFS